MRTQVATVWQLALPGGSTASVERHGAAVLWRLRQPEGRAEVVGLAADEQEGRLRAVRAWRDCEGLDRVPTVVVNHALHGTG